MVKNIDSDQVPKLHYGVNTDAMINGARCTLGYTEEILGPYFLENFKEVIDERFNAIVRFLQDEILPKVIASALKKGYSGTEES